MYFSFLKKDFFHNIPVQMGVIVVAFLLKDSFGNILSKFDQIFSMYSNIVFWGSDSQSYSSYSVENAIDSIGQNISDVKQSGFGVMVKYITYIIIVLCSNKIKKYYDSPKVNVIYPLFFISFIAYIVLPEGVWSIVRPFQYLVCTRTIMLAYMVYYLLKGKNSYNYIVGTLVISSQIILFIASSIISSRSAYYHGYQLFFQV